MSTPRFSTDLLEGYDLLYKRTDETLRSCTEIAKFFKKIATVEAQYAEGLNKISKMGKKAQKNLSKKATEKEVGTLKGAWDTIHGELARVAENHQEISDKLNEQLINPLLNYAKEAEKTRKKLVDDGMKQTRDMAEAIATLQKSRANYYSKCKEADTAQAQYLKVKEDPNMKAKDLNKLQSKQTKAIQVAAGSDKEYQKTLSQTNTKQNQFYTSDMPQLLEAFQQFEENRLTNLKKFLTTFISLKNTLPPLITGSCETMTRTINAVDVASDIVTFVSANKTGKTPPPAIEYEPYDRNNPDFGADRTARGEGGGGAPPLNRMTSVRTLPNSHAGGGSGGGGGEDGENDSDSEGSFSASPGGGSTSEAPEAKKKRLEVQLKELNERIDAESKSQKGLEKLVMFYQSDPIAQEKARQSLQDQNNKITKLKDDRHRVVVALGELGVTLSPEDIGSDSEYSSGAAAAGDTIAYDDSAPSLNLKSRALYDYDATNDTELSFRAGDILMVTEQDDSGWWFAELNGASGFVPNNYVELLEDQ